MVSNRLSGPPRIALLLPVTLDWQAVVTFDLTIDRRRLLDTLTKLLGQDSIVVEASIIESPGDAIAAAERARYARAEATLIIVSMAVLPSVALAAIDASAGRPVVILVLQQDDSPADSVGHAEIVANGGTVGGPMLTSLLVRAGRPLEMILGTPNTATSKLVGRALRAAAAAHRISTARLGRVGLPASGYDSVDMSEDRLHEAFGLSVVRIDPAEFVRTYETVPENRILQLTEEVRSLFTIAPAVSDEDLTRMARSVAALEDLVANYELDAGALTCHIPGVRFEPGLGFAPCFALGQLTSHGIPWSCSSDLPAAVAMLTLNALGAASLYHELEMLDSASGEFLVASSGEHDLRLVGSSRPQLVRNGWFPNDAHPSICACFTAPSGPATLLAFAQIDEPAPAYRYVVASGELSGRTFPQTGTARGALRFGWIISRRVGGHGGAMAARVCMPPVARATSPASLKLSAATWGPRLRRSDQSRLLLGSAGPSRRGITRKSHDCKLEEVGIDASSDDSLHRRARRRFHDSCRRHIDELRAFRQPSSGRQSQRR